MLNIKLFWIGLVIAFVGLFRPSKVIHIVYAQQELEELRRFKADALRAIESGGLEL